MLIISSLTMTFGRRTLWQGVCLEATPGTMTAVVGPSGSGKSTLLHCIGMLIEPTSGHVSFDGVDLLDLSTAARRRFRRDRLGYLFQNFALIEDSTVKDNLLVAMPGVGRTKRRQGLERMTFALGQVGLAERINDPVAELSGGEQQRLALARLLLRSPSLVLADEPTGSLDQDNAEQVIAHLRSFAGRGGTVVIATHDSDVWLACDHVFDLDHKVAPQRGGPSPR